VWLGQFQHRHPKYSWVPIAIGAYISEKAGLIALLPFQHFVKSFPHKKQKTRNHKQVYNSQESHVLMLRLWATNAGSVTFPTTCTECAKKVLEAHWRSSSPGSQTWKGFTLQRHFSREQSDWKGWREQYRRILS
jgi:hypothetical protein